MVFISIIALFNKNVFLNIIYIFLSFLMLSFIVRFNDFLQVHEWQIVTQHFTYDCLSC
jgi:hypothetical protein